MNKLELFITGRRPPDTIHVPDDDFEQIIKETVSDAAHVDLNDVEVSLAENDVIEIKLPLSTSDDAGNLGNAIAAVLDPDVATNLEWTPIHMGQARP